MFLVVGTVDRRSPPLIAWTSCGRVRERDSWWWLHRDSSWCGGRISRWTIGDVMAALVESWFSVVVEFDVETRVSEKRTGRVRREENENERRVGEKQQHMLS